jgi:NADPH:quinone reductase-like Zn-dependent oxidoreductase
MSQPLAQELVLCGEFLSLKDPDDWLKLDDELRLKENVGGVSAGQVDVIDKRNDGSLDEAKKDVDYRQKDVDSSREVEIGEVSRKVTAVVATVGQKVDEEVLMCGEFLSLHDPIAPKALTGKGSDSEWQVPETVDAQAQEASKQQVQEPTDSVPDDQLNIAQKTLFWEFLTCKDLDQDNMQEPIQGSVERQVNETPDDQTTPLWKTLSCQERGPEAVEVQMFKTIERQVQGTADSIAADQDNYAVEKTMIWEFLTCTTKDQTVGSVEVQVQEAGKRQAQDAPEGKVEETVDVVPTNETGIVENNPVWNYLTCEDTAEKHVQQETEKTLIYEFMTCKKQVEEMLHCHLPETSECQMLENIEVGEQETADNFRADQVEVAENKLFYDFLTCKDLTLDDDPQPLRILEGVPAPDRAATTKTQKDGNLVDQVDATKKQSDGNPAVDQFEVTKKPNDGAVVEVKKVVENGKEAQIKESRSIEVKKVVENGKEAQIKKIRSNVSPEEKLAAHDPPTMKKLSTKPRASKEKVSVTTAEIRRWAENKDKRQIKAVYRTFGVNPKAVIRMEGQVAIPDPKAEDHVILKVEVRRSIKPLLGQCPLLLNFLTYFISLSPVKMKASTVSVTDCLLRRGVNFDMFSIEPLPATPGCDVVGYIVKLGPKATSLMNDFTYGDRVAALVRKGGNARYISVPVSDLVRVPRSCDSAEAVCMVSIFSTAYLSLKVISSHKPMFSLEGKKALVVGGMDPVGQALVQMLIKARADPVFVTAPECHHTYIRSVLGAYPLPEKSAEWSKYVIEQMDFVFDGECEDRMLASRSALNNGGQLVCFGTRSVLKAKEVSAFGAPLLAHYNKWSAEAMSMTNIDLWESFQNDRTTVKVRYVVLCYVALYFMQAQYALY